MNTDINQSEEHAKRIGYLVAGFINETLTPEEHDELDRWVEESEANMMLFEELTDEKNIEEGLRNLRRRKQKKKYTEILKRISINPEKRGYQIWPYAVAASLILIAVSIYLLLPSKENEVSDTIAIEQTNDILPGTDKALLKLADGRTIVLDNHAQQDAINETGATIIKLDSGQIAYQKEQVALQEVQYNTLTTPKGGQYQVTLSDGTRVWMNAASSLRFPVVFIGNERVVELEGEAYFEVAHDSRHPFHVKAKNQDITVLGTRFNISAYSDDALIHTTLLEGKIQLSTAAEKKMVKPGEQYITGAGGGITKNKNADIEGSVAWREGLFKFKNERIETILKQVSRWYDAQVVYEGSISHHFNGEISRKLPVSKVLALLEKTGRVQFEIEGKKIKVKP